MPGQDLGLIGNKAGPYFRSVGANIVAVMPDVGETPAIADLIGGIRVMLDAYSEGTRPAISGEQRL
mgnify:CR=1 FL=1